MIVAEVLLTEAAFGEATRAHVVGFNDLAKAREEYERVAALLLKRSERGNDLPKVVEVEGASNKVTMDLAHLRAVSLCDFERMNADRIGLSDTFPHLFKK